MVLGVIPLILLVLGSGDYGSVVETLQKTPFQINHSLVVNFHNFLKTLD
jgi:hypothetical protein